MSDGAAPYPGLRPFRPEEHPYFFGRFDHSMALYRQLDRGRLLAILGASGSGKSSLILAGLLPLLAAERRADDTPRWAIVTLRPGTHPINRLAAALRAERPDEPVQRIATGIRRTSHGLVQEVGRLLPADREVLILVDQFEELFRYASAEDHEQIGDRDPTVARLAQDDEARRFVETLLTAARLVGGRIRVILTMRSDFVGECDRYRGLAEAVSANQYLTPRLDRDQQTEAIVGPLLRHARKLDPDERELVGHGVADWAGLIEPQLVEQLKNDAGDDPDQLPVMQHALLRCWQHGGGRQLTLEGYQQLGGWGLILSDHADRVMTDCGQARARTVEGLFRALTERDAEGRAIRRPRTITQLVAETGEAEADLRAVVDRFAAPDCSFLVPSKPPDDLVDIGHEALIRQWQKMAKPVTGWLEQEFRDGLIWKSLLVQAEGFGRNPNDVLSAAATEERRGWLEDHSEPWAERYGGQRPAVVSLMRASVQARDKARRFDRLVKYGLAVIACVFLGLSIYAYVQAGMARKTEAEAETNLRDAQEAEARAITLRDAALEATRDAEAARERAEDERARAEALAEKAFQSDALVRARLAEEALAAGRPQLAYRTALSALLEPPERPYNWRAGNSLARIASDARLERVLSSMRSPFSSVAFSPDGSRVVSGSRDASVRLWDARTGEPLLTLEGHQDNVWSVAFSPDGSRVVSGAADASVRLWNATTGEPLLTLEGHRDKVYSVAFSPDGSRLVSGSADDSVRPWDATTGEPLLTLEGHQDPVTSVAFSPDGQRVLSAGEDRRIILWHAAAGHSLSITQVREGEAFGIAQAKAGRWLAVSTFEGRLWLYDVTNDALRPVASYSVPSDAYWLDVSPSDGRIAVPLQNGDIQIYAPPSDPTWDGLLTRARRLAAGRLTASEKRDLGLEE